MVQYSLKECAERLGLTRQGVLHNVKRGYLRATRIGAYWTVTARDLAQFERCRPKPGPRPKKRREKQKAWERDV